MAEQYSICGFTTICLFIHCLWTSEWFTLFDCCECHYCEHVWICACLNTVFFNSFRVENPGMGFLSYLAILCITCWTTTKLFSIMDEPFYNSINNVWMFQFIYMLNQHIISCCVCVCVCVCYSCSSECIAVLVSVKWCLIVVFICISLMINDAKHLFMGSLFVHFLWGNIYSRPCLF